MQMSENVLPAGFRSPPYNIDAEQAIIGALLIDNSRYQDIGCGLKPEHFFEPTHRKIYEAIQTTIEAGKVADSITLRHTFQDEPALKDLNTANYLSDVALAGNLTFNVGDYSRVVVDLAARRQIIYLADAVSNRAYDPTSEEAAQQIAVIERDLELLRSEASQAGLDVVSANSLLGHDVQPRQWLVDGWLPKGAVTSYYGPGGVGKSLTALQVAIAVSLGLPFFGIGTEQAPVLGIFCEDDANELHRRLVSCCRSMSVNIGDLTNLHWSARCGEGFEGGSAGNLIARVDKSTGILIKMPLYGQIKKAALDRGARLIILDNISHIFGGNENERSDVTQFLNLLNELAQAIDGAVLLIGHTAKAEGSEYSGCTAWNNDIRSRWLIKKASPDEDEDDEDLNNARVLSKLKANYSQEEDIVILWDDGAFKREIKNAANFVDTIERRNRDRKAEEAFLTCLDELTKQERHVSHSENSKANFAPRVMARMSAANGFSFKQLREAMERLFNQNAIKADQPVGTYANRTKKLGVARS